MALEIPAGFEELPARGGFAALVGPLYVARREAGIVCGFRAGEQHSNPRGVVHGGMLVSLADHYFGMLAFQALQGGACATVSLNTDFLASARTGDWVECAGRITRRTSSLIFIGGEVRTGERLLGTATGIWKRLSTRSQDGLATGSENAA